jgi:hypothetical protein
MFDEKKKFLSPKFCNFFYFTISWLYILPPEFFANVKHQINFFAIETDVITDLLAFALERSETNEYLL